MQIESDTVCNIRCLDVQHIDTATDNETADNVANGPAVGQPVCQRMKD